MKEPYREAGGAFIWLADMSRRYISRAVRSLARHAHDATPKDWRAVTKILGYLGGTKDLGLKFTGKGGRLVAHGFQLRHRPRG